MGKLKRIYIDRATIRENHSRGTRKPPISVRTYKGVQKAHEAVVRDSEGNEVCRFIYSPDKPLSSGARLWVTTHLDVDVITWEES